MWGRVPVVAARSTRSTPAIFRQPAGLEEMPQKGAEGAQSGDGGDSFGGGFSFAGNGDALFIQRLLQRLAAVAGAVEAIRGEEAPLLAVVEFPGGGDETGGGDVAGEELPAPFLRQCDADAHAAHHPAAAIYARPDGTPADVYFYPRTDGWLLGGTRLESNALDAATPPDPAAPWPWQGEKWTGPTLRLPREGHAGATLEVPAPIVELNRTLIQRLTGLDAQQFPLTAMEGYRHKRDTVRLERADWRGTPVIHNYGHGGAGVTLSWSCAVKIAELLSQTSENSSAPLHEIEARLLEQIRRW